MWGGLRGEGRGWGLVVMVMGEGCGWVGRWLVSSGMEEKSPGGQKSDSYA